MVVKNATYFQQDGATPHTARIVTQWFQQQPFQLLTGWPGNLPDLSVIENCWGYMKDRAVERKPTSLQDFIDIIKHVWIDEITVDNCQILFDSMPHIASCLKK